MASTSSITLEDPIPSTSNKITNQPISNQIKLSGHSFFESIGSPKYVVAPMVDQSELAWRILSRIHGATLAYTPMFHAGLFSSSTSLKYFQESFDTSPTSLEGIAPYDRPLIVQFCANDKELWLKAAEKVVGRCDAVDLNLGCPQGIAKKGHYGAFLMDEWELVGSMISHLHENLTLPVIAKIRVFPSLSKTLDYASHVFSSGAQLLTIHGRTRDMKGQLAGLADWTKIKAVTSILGTKIPIFSNGGIPSSEEIENCLIETGSNGVMSAEGNLYNPMIFSPLNFKEGKEYREKLPLEMRIALDLCDSELVGTNPTSDSIPYAFGPSTYLASQYLAIVETLPSTETGGSAIKSHLFKLFRPIWAEGKHIDLRERLANGSGGNIPKSNGKSTRSERLQQVKDVVDEMRRRILADTEAGLLLPNTNRLLTQEEILKDYGGIIPYSHAQPYFRIATTDSVSESTSIATSEVTGVGAVLNKRAHSPSPDASTSTSTTTSIPQPSDSKKLKKATGISKESEMITVPCIRHSHTTTKCVNASSIKCSHLACSVCCVVLSRPSSSNVGTGEVTGTEGHSCPFHLEKQRKEKEKNESKKNHAKEKKRLHKERNLINSQESERIRLIKKEEKTLAHQNRLVEESSKRLEKAEDEKVEVVEEVKQGDVMN